MSTHKIPGVVGGVTQGLIGGKIKWLVAGVALVMALSQTYFVVAPTDRANVRRLGNVRHPTPLNPGLYFKLPLVDMVDVVQVSLTTLHVAPFFVMTIDNQKIGLDINFNFTIPMDKVNHLLYEVGGAGNVDVVSSVVPIVRDRAARVFAIQNMVSVNEKREAIQAEIERSVSAAVKELFGIETHSLQIAGITPSDAFMKSNEAAVKAKNDAVAAENNKRVKQFESEQVVIKAKGDADSAIEAARGRSQSMLLEAEADKQRLVLEGQGQAARLKAEIEPFGSAEMYIKFLQAKAANNWNGTPPQIVAGSGGSMNVVVPVPSLADYPTKPAQTGAAARKSAQSAQMEPQQPAADQVPPERSNRSW
ncbi:MAG: SPFH domain-containing protein [Magnetococcus sp. DMHC-1]|nr:hypothetical protein [Magnetococcales bacterium]